MADEPTLCLDTLIYPAGTISAKDVVVSCDLPPGHRPPHEGDGWRWT